MINSHRYIYAKILFKDKIDENKRLRKQYLKKLEWKVIPCKFKIESFFLHNQLQYILDIILFLLAEGQESGPSVHSFQWKPFLLVEIIEQSIF